MSFEKEKHVTNIKNMCLSHLESFIFFKKHLQSCGLLQVSRAEFSPDHMSYLTGVTPCGSLSFTLDCPCTPQLREPLSTMPEKQRQAENKTYLFDVESWNWVCISESLC